MANSIASASVGITADVSPLKSQIDKATGYLDEFDRKAKRTRGDKAGKFWNMPTGGPLIAQPAVPKILSKPTVLFPTGTPGWQQDAIRRSITPQIIERERLKRIRREMQEAGAAKLPSVKPPKAVGKPQDDDGPGLFAGMKGGPLAAVAVMAAGVAVKKLGAAMLETGLRAVNLAADAESTAMAFEVMLGSADKAGTTLAGLRKFAYDTPFGTKEVIANAKLLLAYSTAADQLIPTLRMLGDVAAVSGTDLSRIALAYGQVMTAGHLRGQELRQFTEAGVDIIPALAKVKGVQSGDLEQLIESRNVGSDDLMRAIQAMTSGSGLYANGAAKLATTFKGVREQLADSGERLLTNFGKAVIDDFGLKTLMKDVTGWVGKAEGKLNDLRPALRFLNDAGRTGIEIFGRQGATIERYYAKIGDVLISVFPKLREFGSLVDDSWKAIKNLGVQGEKAATAVIEAGGEIAKAFLGTANIDKFFDDVKSGLKSVGAWDLNPVKIGNAMFDVADAAIDAIGPIVDAIRAVEPFIRVSLVNPFKDFIAQIDLALARLAVIPKLMQIAANPAGFVAEKFNSVVGKAGLEREAAILKGLRDNGAGVDLDFVTPLMNDSLRELQKKNPGFAVAKPTGPDDWKLTPDPKQRETHMTWSERAKAESRHGREAFNKPYMDEAFRVFTDSIKSVRFLGTEFDVVGVKASGVADALDELRIPRSIPGWMKEEAKHLNEKFRDPANLFAEEQLRISGLSLEKLIPNDVAKKARDDSLSRFLKDDGAKKIPQNMEYGSKEATEFLVRAMTPRDPKADLAQQQVNLIQQMVEALNSIRKNLADKGAPINFNP